MDKLDILIGAVGGGFAITFGLISMMWKTLQNLNSNVQDIDRRLCRLEGAFTYSQGKSHE